MKNKRDAGLEYVLELDFRPERSISGIHTQLVGKCGKDRADEIVHAMEERSEASCGCRNRDDKAFYELKNADYDGSLAVTSAVDGDIIRKICNWIVQNKTLFGKTILEVGCDCGVISCFLGRTFPNSVIHAIDRCPLAIENAKRLANRLGVSNVVFSAATPAEQGRKFDTVFSSRTLHENSARFDEDHTLLVRKQGDIFESTTRPYAASLAGCLSDGGILISIERSERNPLLLGWMLALNHEGLPASPDKQSELMCREFDYDSAFQVTVAHKNQEMVEDDSIFEIFCNTFLSHINLDAGQFDDWEAAIILQNSLLDLIEGYTIYDTDGTKAAKVAAWTNRWDEDSVLIEQHVVCNGIHKLSNCDKHITTECIDSIRATAREGLQLGRIVKKLSYKNREEIETGTVEALD